MGVSSVKTQHTASTHKPSAPAVKVPTKTQLNNVLGNWGFQSRNNPNGVWRSTTKPADLKPSNILKTIVLEKPKAGIMGGATVTAYILKNHPNMVIFEKTQALAPPNGQKFFGPVRNDISPK